MATPLPPAQDAVAGVRLPIGAPTGRAVLRPYQEEALRAIVDAAARGARRLLVVSPVGSGKTILGARVPEQFGDGGLVWICHREELVRQTLAVLGRERPDRSIAIERAEAHADPTCRTVIATIQSLSRPTRLARYTPAAWPLMVIDECHRSAAPSYLATVRHFQHLAVAPRPARRDGLLLGLTGTSRRTDHIGLGAVFEEIPYTITLRALIEQQWLAPVRGYLLRAGAHLDRVRVRVTADGERDYEPHALVRAVNTPARNRLVVQATRELCLQPGRERPTLVFACDIAHTEALADAFREAGIRAAALHSQLDRGTRASMLDRFRHGQLQVLVNCELLLEGVDLPLVSAIVMARPTQSSLLFTQALGRGVRLSPETGKTDCLVIDLVDNAPKHAPAMVTLPTLFGLPPLLDLNGHPAHDVLHRLETAAAALETGLDDATVQQIRSPDDIPRIFREWDFWRIAAIPPAVSAYTRFAWQRLPSGAYTLYVPRRRPPVVNDGNLVLTAPGGASDGGGQLVIDENALGHAEVHYRSGPGPAVKLGEVPDLATAFHVADTVVADRYADRLAVLAKDAPWRHRPVSPRQLEWLGRLRVKVSRALTAGQASLLIDHARALRLERRAAYQARMSQPATAGQLRYLRVLKVATKPGLSKRDAGRLIRNARQQRKKRATTGRLYPTS